MASASAAQPSCVVCTTVRNCGQYLPTIFENIKALRTLFGQFAVIISYDNCTDNSEQLIKDFQAAAASGDFEVHIRHNSDNNHHLRTVRIATARNACIDILHETYPETDYHIFLDADNVNAKPYNVETVRTYLTHPQWDCLSFFNNDYYDIWALLYDNIKHHCWGYTNSRPVVNAMARDIVQKLQALPDGDLYPCISAFNGFAIYRTAKFKYIKYSGTIGDFMDLFTADDRATTLTAVRGLVGTNDFDIIPSVFSGQCCEHLYYHINATRRYGARIRISKDSIFA